MAENCKVEWWQDDGFVTTLAQTTIYPTATIQRMLEELTHRDVMGRQLNAESAQALVEPVLQFAGRSGSDPVSTAIVMRNVALNG